MTADAGGVGAPRFDVVLRGYDRRQVDEHVARLQRVVSRMRADLEMVRSQPIPVVQAPPPGFGGPGPGRSPRPAPRPRSDEPDMIGSFTDRMQSILQAAEEEAAEIRNKARAGARAESESVRAELADLMRQRDAVLAELTRLRGQLGGQLAAPTAQMTAAPRGGGPGGRPAQTAVPGASHPGQPPGPERPAPAGGPPRPRPSPSPTGPPRNAGQQPGAAQPGVPQPASAQAIPPRPGVSAPGVPRSGQGSPQQQPTNPQSAAAPPRPASAQQSTSSTPPQSATPQSTPQSAPPQPKASQVASQQPNAQQPNAQPSDAKDAPPAGGEAGQNGSPSKGSNGSVPQNGVTRGAAANPAPSAARTGEPRPPASEPGKASHRLPTGAYPAVAGEQSSSMRPRSEPEPEPGDLFRPAAPQGRDAKPAEKPGPPVRKPGDVEATVKVGLVRPVAAPSDRTVLSPAVAPADKKDAGKDALSDAKRSDGDGSAGPGHPDRSTSTSRSG